MQIDAIASEILETALNDAAKHKAGPGFGAALERRIFEILMQLGRAALTEFIEADWGEAFEEGPVVWRRAVQSNGRYVTLFGDLCVQRSLYRAVRNGPTRAPVDEQLGIIDKVWTPESARLSALLLTEQTSRSAAKFLSEYGGLSPSRTRLEKLPGQLGRTIEAHRDSIDAHLREISKIPANATSVAVSLDGVMVKLQEPSTRQACVERANEEGRQVRGPVASREASVGALTFYDTDGERLLTRRFARMPEAGKQTLVTMLKDELAHVRDERPDLTVVALADGAACNWRILGKFDPDREVVDAFHTLEHIKRRLDRAFGVNSHRTQAIYAEMKSTLLILPDGHVSVFSWLESLEKEAGTFKPRRRTGKGAQPSFYELHHERMQFHELKAAGLPIGSGVIEGTARYMVVDRLRRSGMRWKMAGGQAILTLRSYAANDQFNAAWDEVMCLHAANSNTAKQNAA